MNEKHIKVTPEVHKETKIIAAKTGREMMDIATEALKNWINEFYKNEASPTNKSKR